MRTILVTLALCALATGCSSREIKQRDYVDPTHLGAILPVAEKEGEGPVLRRLVTHDTYSLLAEPVTEGRARQLADELAFRKKLSPKENEALARDMVRAFSQPGCFHIFVKAPEASAANLNNYHFTLENEATGLVPLTSQTASPEPSARMHVGSYSTGGYTNRVGNSYYTTPSRTHTYSYHTYDSSNYFCADKKVAFEKGFTIYVEPRFKRGLPVADLVWSVNPEDKKTYRLEEGAPHFESTFDGLEWRAARAAEAQKKVSTPAVGR